MAVSQPPRSYFQCTLARWMTAVFIILTAALSLTWSHFKLLSQDEMYAFQTDRVPTLGELVRVQEHWPISLDPMLYHAISHGAMTVFGVGPFALRLGAFLGFLLMQVCLYFFVRNMAGDRAGAVAAVFPALTYTLFYSAEGRPYGLMLGLYALALLCWQRTTTRSNTAPRRWPLIGLAVAIAATINAHYFGVLLLIPICAGELFRTLKRRRLDWPVLAAIAAGVASVIFTKPFLAGAAEFKVHYYNAGTVGLRDITRAYRTLFVDYTKMSMGVQHVAMVLLVVYAAALIWSCWRAWQTNAARASNSEWVAILSLAALPFFGYLLARFVTHSIEVRYILSAIVALSAMTAIGLTPWLNRDSVFNAVLVIAGLALLGTGIARIASERRSTADEMASLVLPDAVRAAVDASPGQLLYIQDMGLFEIASYYEPDPVLRSHITLVYSEDEELRWDRHDTMGLTAAHMQHFTGLRVVPYESLRQQPGEHIFILDHSGWDWTDQAFAEDHAQVTPLGRALGGDAAAIRFSPAER